MKDIKNHIIYGLLLITFASYSQDLPVSSAMYPELSYYGLSGDVFHSDYLKVKGSAFLYNDWQKGEIVLKNGDILTNINLKFDLYINSLIVYHDLLHHQILIDKGNIKSFTIKSNSGIQKFTARDLTGIKTKYETSDDIIMQVLVEGKVSFYKFEYRKMQKQAKSDETTIAEFLNRKEYHILIKGQDYNIKWKKKLLLNSFSEHKSEMNEYIHQNHLKLRKEGDYIKLVEFLNTQLEEE